MRRAQLRELALRYAVRGGRRGRHLSSFLSLLTAAGLVLAVALLVLVLSVMNGFDREMRENILALVPQLSLRYWPEPLDWPPPEPVPEANALGASVPEPPADSTAGDALVEPTALSQLKAPLGGSDNPHSVLLRALATHPQVTAAAPFVEFQGMIVRGATVETAGFFGIDPPAEARAAALPRALGWADWERFRSDQDGIILGAGLADALGIAAGGRATLIAPSASGAARFRHVSVAGLLETGTELDEAAAFLHLETAAELAGRPGAIDGYRLQLRDLFTAPRAGWELTSRLPQGFYARDWTQTHGNLYAAIQLSGRLVGVLLLSIIAVAAFNLVSSLVLVVMDKRADIAILRAMGATPADINGIFLRQGLFIALAGAGLGSALGALLSAWITSIVAGIEAALGIRFLDTDVYPLAYLPADLRLSDLALINGAALALCFLAALYPARRAAMTPPADALRHE